MAWFADGASIDYFGFGDASRLRAIGWLERGRDYARGEVEETVFASLFAAAGKPWQPCVSAGWHDCDLCRFAKGPTRVTYRGDVVTIGAKNLFFPGGRGLRRAVDDLALHRGA